jgi:4-amino-4-deoxy-L-arabinose transferase-like glycosyltransferase
LREYQTSEKQTKRFAPTRDLIKKGKSLKQIKSTRSSGLKELVDHRALRAVVLVAVLLLATYTAFFRLGLEDWHADEPTYRIAGLAYVQDGDFSINQEHPFLAKYILGVTQLVSGSSEAEVVRFPAAMASLLTGLVLFVFARRVAGYWVGVLALAMWTISPLTLAFGRVATLEVFLAFFSTLALYLGWRWAESGSWWFAGCAGVAVGLATASKVVGILFVPAILLVGLLKLGVSRRFFFQGMLVSLAAAVTALVTYAPLGIEASSAIRYMLEKQSRHNARGHGVTINGVSYKYPPWWGYLWWQWKLYGTLASLSLGVAVVLALVRRRALELYLLAAALVPFLVLSFYAQVKLSHYLDAWQPPLILLVALVAGKLARHRILGGIVAVLLLAPFVYLGIQTVQAVSQVQPGPKVAVAEYLKGTGHDQGPILVWGSGGLIKEYLPEARLLKKPEDAQGEEIEAVIVDKNTAKRKPNRSVESYLATNRDRFESSNPVDDLDVYTRKSQQPAEDGE